MTDKAVHIALYPSDWLAGTRGLTPAETGVYITLVCMMYERQGPLAFDQARLARMCNCPAGTFKKILAVLMDEGKLIETPDGLWQRRVETEIAAAKEAIGASSERARRAAEARWSKDRSQSDERENAKVKPQSDEQQDASNTAEKANENSAGEMHEHCPSNANQNQNQSQKDISSSSSARGADDAPPEWTPDRLWDELISAVGVDQGRLPSHWMPPAAVIHAWRWVTDWKIPPESVVDAARNSRKRHDTPPSGPKALDTTMRSLANAIAGESLPPITAPTNSAPAARPGGHGIVPQVPEKYRQ